MVAVGVDAPGAVEALVRCGRLHLASGRYKEVSAWPWLESTWIMLFSLRRFLTQSPPSLRLCPLIPGCVSEA